MDKTIPLQLPTITLLPPSQNKWQREYAAFRRLLPQLLTTHAGKFVAIHGEQVVDSGDEKLALALQVLAKLGNTDIHIGWVAEEAEPMFRSGIRRDGLARDLQETMARPRG